MESSDKKSLVEILFDDKVSDILQELEDGEKEISYISNKLKISEEEILKRLSYLLEKKFVKTFDKNGRKTLLADSEKLSKALENEKNFQTVVDGLTEMDSFLN